VTGLDTNVLVRYLTQDDATQAALANRLIEETLTADEPGFVSTVVLVELVWVLESGYGCDRAQISAVLERLLRAKPLVVEQAEVAWRAARLFAGGKADFADCLIERAGHANACDCTITFDRLAARDAGMRMLVGE
jgi:predicted nucleic-acid-binding protein